MSRAQPEADGEEVSVKTRWLDRHIAFPGPYLTLCLSAEEFQAAIAHLKSPEVPRWVSHGADATAHFFDNPDGKTVAVVCLGENLKKRTPVEIAGMLVHEAVHVWQQYCRDIGERHPGNEQEAYAIQNIAQELMAEFARRTTKLSKGKS